MSELLSLKGFEIPELLQMAHSGEKFMYYDSGPQGEKESSFLRLCQPLTCWDGFVWECFVRSPL